MLVERAKVWKQFSGNTQYSKGQGEQFALVRKYNKFSSVGIQDMLSVLSKVNSEF